MYGTSLNLRPEFSIFHFKIIPFITSIALSRNSLYLAVGASHHVQVFGHVQIWHTEAQKLEAEAKDVYDREAAFDGSTAYAKEHGLDSESYPVERCGSNPIPGFSLSYSQSRFTLYVTRRKPASTNSAGGSSSMCSCTSKAMADFYLDDGKIWMLGYVSGLDIRQKRAKPPFGMIAARTRKSDPLSGLGPGDVFSLFLIIG